MNKKISILRVWTVDTRQAWVLAELRKTCLLCLYKQHGQIPAAMQKRQHCRAEEDAQRQGYQMGFRRILPALEKKEWKHDNIIKNNRLLEDWICERALGIVWSLKDSRDFRAVGEGKKKVFTRVCALATFLDLKMIPLIPDSNKIKRATD